jgi:hypothetical protein
VKSSKSIGKLLVAYEMRQIFLALSLGERITDNDCVVPKFERNAEKVISICVTSLIFDVGIFGHDIIC